VNALVVLGNRLDIAVPAIFSAHLLEAFGVAQALSESLVAAERPSAVSLRGRIRHFIPLQVRLSQEWNAAGKLLGLNCLVVRFVLVRHVSIQDEGRCVDGRLELALSGPHG